jgi:kynureninase
VYTGWFSEFGELSRTPRKGEVVYGEGAARFAGATYDPTAHYRAEAVFAFFDAQELTPARLREINQRQVRLLRDAIEALDLDPSVARIESMPDDRRGGFLAVRTPRAAALVRALRSRGVWTDSRGDVLRLGPAPYLRDEQLRDGVQALAESL